MKTWLRACLITVAVALVSGGLFACTFEDGNPPASASGSFELAFDVPDGRLDDDGRIKTANDYRIDVDEMVLDFGPAELIQSAAAADVSFDPADPPPGYSLCHNGHCHSASGELVDYDEIIAELGDAAGVDATRTVVLSSVVGDISSSPLRADFEDCPAGACPLPAASITGIDTAISSIGLKLTVSDARDGDRQRVSPFEADVTLAVESRLRAVVNEAVEYHGDNDLQFSIRIVIPARVLDAIDWAALGNDASTATYMEAADALQAALEEQASFTIDIRRSSF